MEEPGADLASVAGRLTGSKRTHRTGLAWRRSGCCDSLPSMPDGSEIAALKAALAASEAKASGAEARAANAKAQASDAEAQIAALKLMIEKLRRALFGQRSERKQRLLDQLELQLDELEASATEDELAAEQAAAGTTQVKAFTRRRRSGRKPFPEHLPRERVVVAPPDACACCGSQKPSKIGEGVTETLEVIPRQWKVIQTVREKFTCRDCEKISQPPAPFHPTPRGWAGPNLLAMILFEKYGQHQPLNRQRDRYRARGRRPQPIDPGRPGRRLHGGAAPAARPDRGTCHGSRTPAWRRHAGAGAGQGQDRQRPGRCGSAATGSVQGKYG